MCVLVPIFRIVTTIMACVRVFACDPMFMHAYIHIYTHTHIRTYIRTHIHTYAHTPTHIHHQP